MLNLCLTVYCIYSKHITNVKMGFEPPPSEFIYQKKNTGSYYYFLISTSIKLIYYLQPSLYGYQRKFSGLLVYFREYTYAD